MENVISWVEIPASDFSRAVNFYSNVLSTEIEENDMFGSKMGFFPMDGNNVSGAIISGDGYEPSDKGPLVYLNGGNDLQVMLDRVETNNGKIVIPKTQISEEMGFFAHFIDSEGNKMGLHSMS